jgi:hypothetical protein
MQATARSAACVARAPSCASYGFRHYLGGTVAGAAAHAPLRIDADVKFQWLDWWGSATVSDKVH